MDARPHGISRSRLLADGPSGRTLRSRLLADGPSGRTLRSWSARFEPARSGRNRLGLRIAVGYALLASVAAALGLSLRDGPLWSHPAPLLTLSPAVGLTLSASLGVAFGSALVLTTPWLVSRFRWAQRLHADLRPVARELGSIGEVLLIAATSTLGEELLFRGLLTPAIGVVASTIIFALAHQLPGRSRWVWMAWSCAVGFPLAGIFALTGSLVGPLLAHAIINAANLVYLRDHDPGEV